MSTEDKAGGRSTFRALWSFIETHLLVDAVVIIALMVVVVAVLGWDGDPLNTVRSVLMALLTTAFATCFIGLLFQRSELDKAIGHANARSVLETVFSPKERLYNLLPETDLMQFSHAAAAAANGIEPSDERFGLVKACLIEVSNRLNLPHREVIIFRTCTFDPNYPDIVHVKEVSTTKYVNRSHVAASNQNEWRTVRTPLLPPDAKVPQDVDVMTIDMRMLDKAGMSENSEFPKSVRVESVKNAGLRVWANPVDLKFSVPANCDEMRVEVVRSFYLSIEDDSVEYTWPAPIKSLDYNIGFEGRKAVFTPSIVDCCKCEEAGPCNVCHTSEITLNGGQRANVSIKDWTGSQAHLLIKWKLADISSLAEDVADEGGAHDEGDRLPSEL